MNRFVPLQNAPRVWISTLCSMTLGLATAGCDRPMERSESAVVLPATGQDPREAQADGKFWPGWRGVNASGVSADDGLPVQWSTSEGVRWKVDVEGRGNSSPVVWGDFVLLTSALSDKSGAELVVLAYDRMTGKPRWRAVAGRAAGSTHNKNGYASASVTTDGTRVFASFGPAGLHAFDLANGNRLWRAELGGLDHQWGMASSPVLYENLVIQLCDSETESALLAFDKETGAPVWRTDRPSEGSWSTPVLVEAKTPNGQRRTELIVNGTGAAAGGLVIAYDPADGAELWRVAGTKDVVCPTIIAGGDLVVSTSGRNGPIMAIRPGGSGDVTKQNVVWKHHHGGAYVPTGIAYRNRLYTVADGGVAMCVNLGSGDILWRNRLGGNFTASLIAGDGRVYATSEGGEVHVFAADDEFRPLAMNEMGEPTLATPAVAQGDLFIRTQTQLYAIASQPNQALALESGDDMEPVAIEAEAAETKLTETVSPSRDAAR